MNAVFWYVIYIDKFIGQAKESGKGSDEHKDSSLGNLEWKLQSSKNTI